MEQPAVPLRRLHCRSCDSHTRRKTKASHTPNADSRSSWAVFRPFCVCIVYWHHHQIYRRQQKTMDDVIRFRWFFFLANFIVCFPFFSSGSMPMHASVHNAHMNCNFTCEGKMDGLLVSWLGPMYSPKKRLSCFEADALVTVTHLSSSKTDTHTHTRYVREMKKRKKLRGEPRHASLFFYLFAYS